MRNVDENIKYWQVFECDLRKGQDVIFSAWIWLFVTGTVYDYLVTISKRENTIKENRRC